MSMCVNDCICLTSCVFDMAVKKAQRTHEEGVMKGTWRLFAAYRQGPLQNIFCHIKN